MAANCNNCDLYKRGDCKPSSRDMEWYEKHTCSRYE